MIKLNLRLPDDLYDKAKVLAAANDRSLNSWLVSLVRRTVEDNERHSTPRA
ncbi:Arc family DNA-binding protein [Streptomyces sp. NPDC101776]|uniref:Arc family DNA-binding protein n=1 Tax=Streptomyces sp. NPDC101776 TaxID=3366146 RepID=UPI00381814D2